MADLEADFHAKLRGATCGDRFSVLCDPVLTNDTPRRISLATIQNPWLNSGPWKYLAREGTGLLHLETPTAGVNNASNTTGAATTGTGGLKKKRKSRDVR